uniref:Uncharacterized protein n=1 Tax=Mimiviridae sp. ChoanoV1 TaxID=2596887 RepID=A0A5B8HW16_9VIRU|nr:hypothetical protein 1_248 [Mimiviridae sp. ChoanoV1]
MKDILLFIIIILVLGLVYMYGIILEKKKIEEKQENPKKFEINPTFQFSQRNNNNNNYDISNIEVYDDLLIEDNKNYFNKEFFISFDYVLPDDEYFYFTFIIDTESNEKFKIEYNKNITLRKNKGSINNKELKFKIISNNKNDNLKIKRLTILINNMDNKIVFSKIKILEINLQYKEDEINHKKNLNIENKKILDKINFLNN